MQDANEAAPTAASAKPARPWLWARLLLGVLGPLVLFASLQLALDARYLLPRWGTFGLLPGAAWPIFAALGVLVAVGVLGALRLRVKAYLARSLGYLCLGAVVGVVVGAAILIAFGEDCSYPSSAQWSDPALNTASQGPGWTALAAATGLPLPDGTLPFNGTTVQEVRYQVPGQASFALDREARVLYDGGWDNEARAMFVNFTRGLSSANATTVASWARSLQDGAIVRVAPLDKLASLAANLTVLPPGRYTPQPGSGGAAGPSWSLAFSLPTRERPLADGTLRVDATGNAAFKSPYRHQAFSAYGKEVVRLLQEDGLPAPQPAAVLVGGAIC